MTLTRYVIGVATVLSIVGPLTLCAVAIRHRWLSGWTGPPARLAEAILIVGTFTVVCEALGTVGLFRAGPLVAVSLASGLAALALLRRPPLVTGRTVMGDALCPSQPRWAMPVTTLVLAFVALAWTGSVRGAYRAGMLGSDSIQYHLPFAARFAQTGHLFRLHFVWLDPVATFYPNNSELLHAVGMVAFGRDILSPVINLFWLSLAFLAAWVLGRKFGIGHLAIGMTALVFASPLTGATQPGSALNDTPSIALMLASIALLDQGDRRLGTFAVAGLAAGLAVGTKVSAIAPILALTIVVLVSRRYRRLSFAAVWIGAMAAGGGYWFLRNFVHTGSPMPALALPGFPSVHLPEIQAYGHSVSDYLSSAHFWRTVAPNGLRQVFGPAYAVVLVLAAVGLVAGVFALTSRSERVERSLHVADRRPVTVMLLAVALVAWAAYVITPASAYGPPGHPFLFGASVRYAFPAFLASLLILALATIARRRVWTALLTAVILGVLTTELITTVPGFRNPVWSRPRAFVGILGLWAVWTAVSSRSGEIETGKRHTIAFSVATAALVVMAGYPVAQSYAQHRYTDNPLWSWARTVHHARIAVVGYADQYPLTGLDLSNRVQYLGRRGRRGSFTSYGDCSKFRSALRAGHYEYLVAGTAKSGLEPAPERHWEDSDAAATPILHDKRAEIEATLFRIRRSADPQSVLCK
jgi:hypothetical protein